MEEDRIRGLCQYKMKSFKSIKFIINLIFYVVILCRQINVFWKFIRIKKNYHICWYHINS